MAILLAFTICAYPFVCAKKADAIAPVVGAGAAAAALAAELGISTEALFAGLVAVTAAGTGVYLLNSGDYATSAVSLNDTQWRNLWDGTDLGSGYEGNWAPEYQKWKLGNGKSWEDLTPEERQNWSSPAEYDQAQLLGYALETGLISEIAGGGGYEPTPEPDPDTDPDGHARWQKARNVLTVLGVSGGAVALNDAVGWLGDVVGNGIHDLIFGQSGLGLPETVSFSVGDVPIVIEYASLSYNGNDMTNNWLFKKNWVSPGIPVYYVDSYNGELAYSSLTYTQNNGVYASSTSRRVNRYFYNNGNLVQDNDYLGNTAIGTANNQGTINGAWRGTYNFRDSDGNLLTTLHNGVWSNPSNVDESRDYESMPETPSGLTGSLGNNNTWNNYINNASLPDGQGNVNAVTVPAVLSDGLTYNDIVKPVGEDEVTPIPDDQPITPPQPEPEPGLSPNAPEGFEDDLGESVERILRNPFDQVFPFCLIADFRDFIFIFLAGDTEIGQNTQRLRPQSLTVQSDVSTDELNGVHSIKLDLDESFEGFEVDIPLDPVHDLLAYSRIPLTVLFALALVYESFSFFLKRGGE